MNPTCESSGSRAAGGHRVQRDGHAAPEHVILDAIRFRGGERIGFATKACQHRAARVEHLPGAVRA